MEEKAKKDTVQSQLKLRIAKQLQSKNNCSEKENDVMPIDDKLLYFFFF